MKLICGADEVLEEECTLSIPRAGVEIFVVMPSNQNKRAINGEGPGIDVHDEQGNTNSLGIVDAEGDAPGNEETPLAGHYTGTLSFSLGGRIGHELGRVDTSALTLSVEANVFTEMDGSGVLELISSDGTTLPGGRVVLPLGSEEGDLNIQWPDMIWYGAGVGGDGLNGAHTPDLIAHWAFEGDFGDSSPHEHTGSVFMGQTPGFSDGVVGQAAHFDGEDDWVRINDLEGALTPGDDVILDTWFRTDAQPDVNSGNILFSVHSDEDDNLFRVGTGSTGGIFLSTLRGGTEECGSGYNNDEWHHLVVHVSGDAHNISVRVNGSGLADCGRFKQRPILWDEAAQFSIGQEHDSAGPSDFWSGHIDELRLFAGGTNNFFYSEKASARILNEDSALSGKIALELKLWGGGELSFPLSLGLLREGPLEEDLEVPQITPDVYIHRGPPRRGPMHLPIRSLIQPSEATLEPRETIGRCTSPPRSELTEQLCDSDDPDSFVSRFASNFSSGAVLELTPCYEETVGDDPTLTIPCAYNGNDDGQVVNVDNCAELESLGCDIPDEFTRFNEPRIGDTWYGCVISSSEYREMRNEPTRATANQCIGAALCEDSPDVPSSLSTEQEGISSITGDLWCSNQLPETSTTTSKLAPGLDLTLEGALEDFGVLKGLLDTCTADLRTLVRLHSRVIPPGQEILDTDGCFSAGRLLVALEFAVTFDHEGRLNNTGGALAHRIVQQLVEIQALNVQIALDYHRQALLGLAPQDQTVLSREDVLEALDASQRAWSVGILDPRVAGVILNLDRSVVVDPDPRGYLDLEVQNLPSNPSKTLDVTVVESLSAELELLDFLLERAWYEGNEANLLDIEHRIDGLAQRTKFILPLMDALTGDFNGLEIFPERREIWRSTRNTYLEQMSEVKDRLAEIEQGINPLGFAEGDVPFLPLEGDSESSIERFRATSRSLIGTGPGDPVAKAPVAIALAATARDDAREEYRYSVSTESASNSRIDEIKARYGELITGFCGAPIDDPDFDIGSFNVLSTPIDVETCFIEPECRPRLGALVEELTSEDLHFSLCVASNLDSVIPDVVNALRMSDELSEALEADYLDPEGDEGNIEFEIQELIVEPNEHRAVVTLNGSEPFSVTLDELIAIQIPQDLSSDGATKLQKIQDDCESVRQSLYQRRSGDSQDSGGACDSADDCKKSLRCVGGSCTPTAGQDQLDQTDCYYDGAMSEQVLAVRGAAIEVEIARLEMDEFFDRYDIAMQSCLILKAGNERLEERLDQHNSHMRTLQVLRATAASAAHGAAAVKDCVGASTGTDVLVTGGVGAALTCGAAAAEGLANIAVEVLDASMAEAERDHEELVLDIENDIEEELCFNDAEMELVGAKAATLRIKRALQDQTSALINLRGQKSYTDGLWNEGNYLLAKEERRLESALPSRFVLSAKTELYQDRFRHAQRLTYLAVRAVEYEFQAQLTSLRSETLAAIDPAALEEVIRALSAEVNNGRVAGSRPDGLLAVVSLREHLLQLRDRSDNPEGEHNLTSPERFQALLGDEQYAVFSEDGTYRGQRIPFTLQPLGAFGLGETQGVPIVAQNDCAERIWSVNAAVITTEPLDDDESSFVRMDLLQRNTFSSQRCRDPREDESRLVTTSVKPSINLLQDHSRIPLQQNPVLTATDTFSRALLQPYLNVSRQEFEEGDYAQGSAEQLAGRGLYGDYALFIGADSLSIDDAPGLRLDNIDDILLRIDYLAVARP